MFTNTTHFSFSVIIVLILGKSKVGRSPPPEKLIRHYCCLLSTTSYWVQSNILYDSKVQVVCWSQCTSSSLPVCWSWTDTGQKYCFSLYHTLSLAPFSPLLSFKWDILSWINGEPSIHTNPSTNPWSRMPLRTYSHLCNKRPQSFLSQLDYDAQQSNNRKTQTWATVENCVSRRGLRRHFVMPMFDA